MNVEQSKLIYQVYLLPYLHIMAIPSALIGWFRGGLLSFCIPPFPFLGRETLDLVLTSEIIPRNLEKIEEGHSSIWVYVASLRYTTLNRPNLPQRRLLHPKLQAFLSGPVMWSAIRCRKGGAGWAIQKRNIVEIVELLGSSDTHLSEASGEIVKAFFCFGWWHDGLPSIGMNIKEDFFALVFRLHLTILQTRLALW